MFGFIKKVFFTGLTTLSTGVNSLTATRLSCISMTNKEWKVRPKIVNVNSDELVFYPFGIKTSKCSGSCNNINDPYARMCVPDVVKNLNVKVFNLISRTIDTQNGMKRVSVNVDQMQRFVIINKAGIMINAGTNAKN